MRLTTNPRVDAHVLLDIYSLGETEGDDGTRIVLFDLKGDDLKQAFYAFLGRRPNDTKRVWLRIILSGDARSPTQVKSTEDLLDKLASPRSHRLYPPGAGDRRSQSHRHDPVLRCTMR